MARTLQKKSRPSVLVASLAATVLVASCTAPHDANWQNNLEAKLPIMGHRNWIVIADSAYPAQSRSGIETIATGADQIEVVKQVLKAVDKSGHIRANVYLDAEMKFVSETDAPGIAAYRNRLSEVLADRSVNVLPHEKLIADLDQAAKTFRVVILKTNLTLPYTSVFLQLDCGYWNAQAEQKMRDAMRQAADRQTPGN